MGPLLQAKADAVVAASGLNPGAVNLGSVLQIIEQILSGLALCPGLGVIAPPTAATVHGALSAPTPQQARTAKRLVRREFRRQPQIWENVLEGLYATGKAMSVADSSALFKEVNGVAPSA